MHAPIIIDLQICDGGALAVVGGARFSRASASLGAILDCSLDFREFWRACCPVVARVSGPCESATSLRLWAWSCGLLRRHCRSCQWRPRLA